MTPATAPLLQGNIISAEGLWCLAEENCNEDVLTTDNLVVLQLEFASPLR